MRYGFFNNLIINNLCTNLPRSGTTMLNPRLQPISVKQFIFFRFPIHSSPFQSNKYGLEYLSRNWSAIATKLSCGLWFSAPKARPKKAQGKRPQGASP